MKEKRDAADVNTSNVSLKRKKFWSKYFSHQIFTADEQLYLKDYLITCSNMNYGLTYQTTKTFLYQPTTKNPSFVYPETWNENEMAGIDYI